MRKIYLIRHAKPFFPEGKKMCYGSTDVPLDGEGRAQCERLRAEMADRPVTKVFCSDLSRSIQTAQYLAAEPVILPGLRELDAGDWDGLSFEEIRVRWPEVYARRGIEPGYPIPGAEDLRAGRDRFLAAVEQALAQSEGDIAIVGHASVNQTLICQCLGIPLTQGYRYKPDYASVTEVEYDGRFRLARDILLK